MSLSRRACYKCGAIGHFAEVCTSPERLCYNCKQPGHESNVCPQPRTADSKQCYHCQGFGHVQADCPTLRLSGAGTGARCYSCGNPGHLARNCPTGSGLGRGAPMGRGGFGFGGRGAFGGARPATCYKCGGPNHYARDCQAQAMKCYACGKLGHISRDCTAPNGGPLSTAGKTCYRCGQAGHISRECPQPAEEVIDPSNVNNVVPASKIFLCKGSAFFFIRTNSSLTRSFIFDNSVFLCISHAFGVLTTYLSPFLFVYVLYCAYFSGVLLPGFRSTCLTGVFYLLLIRVHTFGVVLLYRGGWR